MFHREKYKITFTDKKTILLMPDVSIFQYLASEAFCILSMIWIDKIIEIIDAVVIDHQLPNVKVLEKRSNTSAPHHNFLSEFNNWIPDVDEGSEKSINNTLSHNGNGKINFTVGIWAQILIAWKGISTLKNLLNDYY